MEELKQLTIKNYYYDSESTDKLNSLFYISEESEDDYIRISPIEYTSMYLVTFVIGCEEVKIRVTTFDHNAGNNISVWLNKEIEDLQKC